MDAGENGQSIQGREALGLNCFVTMIIHGRQTWWTSPRPSRTLPVHAVARYDGAWIPKLTVMSLPFDFYDATIASDHVGRLTTCMSPYGLRQRVLRDLLGTLPDGPRTRDGIVLCRRPGTCHGGVSAMSCCALRGRPGLAARPGLLPGASCTLAGQPVSGPYRQAGRPCHRRSAMTGDRLICRSCRGQGCMGRIVMVPGWLASPLVGQEFAVQRDDHPVAAGIGFTPDVQAEVDRAHDAVAELLVDELLDRRAVDLEHLVEPVDRRVGRDRASPARPGWAATAGPR